MLQRSDRHDGFDVTRWSEDEVDVARLPGFECRVLHDALDQFLLTLNISGEVQEASLAS